MRRVQLNCPWILQNNTFEMYPVLVYIVGAYTFIADDPQDPERLICECEVTDVVAAAMALNPLVDVLESEVIDGIV